MRTIKVQVPARIGLWGNPSDGFGGKVLACTIDQFHAQVSIGENTHCKIYYNPRIDWRERYIDPRDIHQHAKRYGYLGARPLIMASIAKFYKVIDKHGLEHRDQRFSLSYETDIPRQVGLGGSSALIIATLQALAEFYDLNVFGNFSHLAQVALEVETEELHLTAGPQDRVVQSMGGLIYMDFSDHEGSYVRMYPHSMPEFVLGVSHNKTNTSSHVHEPMKHRYKNDPTVADKMDTIASNAKRARAIIEDDQLSDAERIRKLDFLCADDQLLRHDLYGPQKSTQELIDIFKEFGMSASQTGSGGAVFGIVPFDGKSNDGRMIWEQELREALLLNNALLYNPAIQTKSPVISHACV